MNAPSGTSGLQGKVAVAPLRQQDLVELAEQFKSIPIRSAMACRS